MYVCPRVFSGGLADAIPNQVANCFYRLARGLLSSLSGTAGKWQGQENRSVSCCSPGPKCQCGLVSTFSLIKQLKLLIDCQVNRCVCVCFQSFAFRHFDRRNNNAVQTVASVIHN